MFNHSSLDQLVGKSFFYDDEETGIGWNFHIFEIYREAMFDSVVLILSDNIRIKLSRLDIVRGPECIINKIYNGYKESINNLEYINGEKETGHFTRRI